MMARKKLPKSIMKRITPKVTPIGRMGTEALVLPNHSGDNIKGFVSKTPANDFDYANKKYVDERDALYLQLIGGTVSGILNLDGAPTGLDVLYSAIIGAHLTVGNNLTVGDDITVGGDIKTTSGQSIKVGGVSQMDFITGRIDIPNRIRALTRFDAFGQWNLYNNVAMYFREAAAIRAELRHHTAYNQMTFRVEAGAGNQFILGFYDGVVQNYDHAIQTNPTFYVHSATPPNTANDEWISFTHNVTDGIINTGKGGINFNDKCRFTRIGGYAIKLTNKTGINSVAGKLVKTDTANNDAVRNTGAGDVECIGVFLETGVADGSETWIVISGIADVSFDDNVGTTRGDWVSTGVAGGYAARASSPAAAPTHFEEIGHCLETVAAGGAGTHILARCVLHFN